MDSELNGELQTLLGSEEFQFKRLVIEGIDNEPIFALNVPSARDQVISLFHKAVMSGDGYVQRLAQRIEVAIQSRVTLPVVRFADGEYAFYNLSLLCNGLYRQAESIGAIRRALPSHIEAICAVANGGILAPLVFPGNCKLQRGLSALWRRKDGSDGAIRFLNFLKSNGVRLTEQNYIPFYAVYAYLSSARFAVAMDRRTVCVVNSDYDATACIDWFVRAGSHPQLMHVRIPDSYVATRWPAMRDAVLAQITAIPDLFIVGAGVGALPVCVDLARQFSIPAIDAGHILNMMNNMELKSRGPRFFTHRR